VTAPTERHTHSGIHYTPPGRAGGVWIAYHSDGSGLVVFASELEALRYALPSGMQVKFALFGDPDWKTRDDPPPQSPPPLVCR
jgi:hypothetical protein